MAIRVHRILSQDFCGHGMPMEAEFHSMILKYRNSQSAELPCTSSRIFLHKEGKKENQNAYHYGIYWMPRIGAFGPDRCAKELPAPVLRR